MDAMQDDERGPMIAAMISSAEEGRRVNKLPADHLMLAVLPDWLYTKLNGEDREELLTKQHINVRSHSDFYAEEDAR